MSRNGKAGGPPATLEGAYDARITRQRGGGYLVEFPDLSGCLTEGEDLPAALANAREALSGWLFVALTRGDDIPAARVRTGRQYHRIIPDLDVSVPLAIVRTRQRRRLSRRQVAAALGITPRAYRRFETPGQSNPTLKTLQRLSEILGLEFHPQAA